MNTSTSRLGKNGCQKSILILKDAAVNEAKGTKKHVTFKRFAEYYTYTENWQTELEKTCPLSNDDWGLSEKQLNGISNRGK